MSPGELPPEIPPFDHAPVRLYDTDEAQLGPELLIADDAQVALQRQEIVATFTEHHTTLVAHAAPLAYRFKLCSITTDEIVQNAFESLFMTYVVRRGRVVQHGENDDAYLRLAYSAVWGASIDHARSYRSHLPEEEIMHHPIPEERYTPHSVEKRLQITGFLRQLFIETELNDRERRAVFYHHIMELSHQETAMLLKTTESAARQLTYRALQQLRKTVTKNGYTFDTALNGHSVRE